MTIAPLEFVGGPCPVASHGGYLMPRKKELRSARAVLLACSVAILSIGVFAGSASAGKPSGGTSTTPIRVDDGVFGGTTTAYVGSPKAAWVHAKCYQGSSTVYEKWAQVGAGRTVSLQLGPTPSWTSGAANCWAEEGYYPRLSRWRQISSTTFNAAAG